MFSIVCLTLPSLGAWPRRCNQEPWLLSRSSLDAAIANLGDAGRMRRLIGRLRQGENITVTAIGGSITAARPVMIRGGMSWPRAVVDWLAARWPPRHGHHRLINAAVAATPASYHVMCMQNRVPASVDLILLELGANADVRRRWEAGALEALIRRALSWPSAPAVVLVDWLNVRKYEWHRHGGADPARHDKEFDYNALSPRTVLQQLASWYRVPRLTAAAALVHSDRANVSVYRHEEFAFDWNHPNACGHRMMAELVQHYLLLVEATLREPFASDSSPLLLELRAGRHGLPPPIDTAYWVDDLEGYTCTSGDQLQHISSGDFEFVQSDPDDPRGNLKPGLLSMRIGDIEDLTVYSVHAEVVIGYLVSYSHRMGNAHVKCIGDCKCNGALLIGHHNVTSSTMVATGIVIRNGPLRRCQLRVEHVAAHHSTHQNSDRSTKGGFAITAGASQLEGSKFKLLSVMVTPPGQPLRGTSPCTNTHRCR